MNNLKLFDEKNQIIDEPKISSGVLIMMATLLKNRREADRSI